MTNLTFLTLQANRLTKIEGLETLVQLKELYLSENFITKIEGLNTLVNLEILDIAYNKIEDLENIEKNCNLTDLWLNHNNIKNFADLNILKFLPKLDSIYLWKNPVANFPSYKQTLKSLCPKLTQIDATYL